MKIVTLFLTGSRSTFGRERAKRGKPILGHIPFYGLRAFSVIAKYSTIIAFYMAEYFVLFFVLSCKSKTLASNGIWPILIEISV